MPKTIRQKELTALISLLDDPDEEVFTHVSGKLASLGIAIIPKLEAEWEKTYDPDLHQRLENLVHSIQFKSLLKDMRKWFAKGTDLLEGALLVAKYQYPDLKDDVIRKRIDQLSKEIWLEMNYNLTPLEQVNVFNHVLYTLNGFAADNSQTSQAQHHFLNVVLDTRKGNTVSLSVLYLILAQKLGMPAYGVNLPQHFILSYHKNILTKKEDRKKLQKSVLFYINPFNRGLIFTREDITLYLNRLQLEPKPEHYLPCSNCEIIEALLHSLVNSYELSGEKEKANEILQMKEAGE